MFFATCATVSPATGIGSTCSINIAYNKQLPLCTSSTQQSLISDKRVCRPPDDLCTADADFKFDLGQRTDNEVCLKWFRFGTSLIKYQLQAFVRIPLSDIFPPTSDSPTAPGLLVLDTTQNPPVPVPIKLGDVNQDGFPDFLAVVVTGTGKRRQRTPQLVLSVPCAKNVAGCNGDDSGKRGWHTVKKDVDPLHAIQDARSVAFLDMDEDVCSSLRRWQFRLIRSYREHWISWYSGPAIKVKGTSSSSRTTSTTTHFS